MEGVAKAPDGKVYEGKRFVILLFIGFIVFSLVMTYGTFVIGNTFGKARPVAPPHTANPSR